MKSLRVPMNWLIAMISAWTLCSIVADATEVPLTIEVRSDDLVDVSVSFDPKVSSQPANLTAETGEVKVFTCPLPESFLIEKSRVRIETVHKLPGGGQHYRRSCDADRQFLKSRILRLKGHPGRIRFEELTSKVKELHVQFTGDNGVTLVGSTSRIQLSNLVMHCELPTGKYGITLSLDGVHWSGMKQPLVVDADGGYVLNQSEFSIGQVSLNPKVECEVFSFSIAINTRRPLMTSLIYPDSVMHFTCGDALKIHESDGIVQYRCKLYADKLMGPDELDQCCVTISATPSGADPMGMGNETYQYLIPHQGEIRNLVVKLFAGSIVLPFPAERESTLHYVIRKGSNEYASDMARKVPPDGRLVQWNLPAGRYELCVYDPMIKNASRKWDLVLTEGGDEIQVLRK